MGVMRTPPTWLMSISAGEPSFMDEWVDSPPQPRILDGPELPENIRPHIKSYLGHVPLTSLTSTTIGKMYRQLEEAASATTGAS
jgi:hypothetical protein